MTASLLPEGVPFHSLGMNQHREVTRKNWVGLLCILQTTKTQITIEKT